MSYDLSNHFDEDMFLIEKFIPKKIITVVYFDASSQKMYVKRFQPDNDNNLNKNIDFIGEEPNNRYITFSSDYLPQLKITFDTKANEKEIPDEVINVAEFIAVKGVKAKGKRLSTKVVKKAIFIDPLPYEEPEAKQETNDEFLEETETTKKIVAQIQKDEPAISQEIEGLEITNPNEVEVISSKKKVSSTKTKKIKKNTEKTPEEESKPEDGDSQMEINF